MLTADVNMSQSVNLWCQIPSLLVFCQSHSAFDVFDIDFVCPSKLCRTKDDSEAIRRLKEELEAANDSNPLHQLPVDP
jgi:hypothetical protein